MLIIDRYLLRRFLQAFAIFFCSLSGLTIIIDAFGNLEEFIAFSEKQGSLWGVMAEYYGYRLLSFFDRMSGILTLISAMFTVAAFQRHNELTALMAAGIPTRRILRPVFIAVAGVSLVAAANREAVIPMVRDQFSRNAQDLQGDTGKTLQPRYDNKTDILLRGSQTFAKDKRISQPSFRLPPRLSDYGPQLAAENAFYQPPTADRPGGYLLKGVRQPKGLDQKPSLVLDGEKVVLTPADHGNWLAPDECFVVSEVTFEHLAGAASWRQYSSTPELISGLHNPSLDFGADVRVTIHSRIVQPFLDVTLLFLGLPLILTRESRNMFLAIGMCVGVVAVFLVVVTGLQYLGTSYLISPALAAWSPLMIFVPAAVALSEPLWA